MTERKHTPGPWIHRHIRLGWDEILGPNGEDIASVNSSDGADEPTMYPVGANARLIAAAPEMLAALEVALSTGVLEHGGVDQIVRAAIAKATGG